MISEKNSIEEENIKEKIPSSTFTNKPKHYQDLILNSLPVIYYSCSIDEENKIVWMSDKVKSITGFAPLQFINEDQFWKRNIHPEDLTQTLTDFKKVNSDKNVELTYRWKCADGKYRWFFDKATLIKDENGNPLEIIGIWIDIHDKKLAEESYKDLFNTIEDAIYIQDKSGVFLDVNKGASNMYGYNRIELLGKTLNFLSADGKNDLFLLDEKLALALKGSPQNFEFWGKKKSGEVFLKDVKVFSGTYFGQDVLIVHSQDITKRKQAEEKIQSALSEKNVLLREVHHRVKNNLQAMIYLIEMQIDKLDDIKVQTFLKELQEQAITMSLVYEQLYQSDYLAEVDMDGYLNNLISNVIQAFGGGRDINYKVHSKNVLLDVETAMPCGLLVNELLTNSLKYAFPENLINEPIINVTLKNQNNEIELTVSDNGIGLPKDFDWENTESLGLKLVNFWVKYQLAGSIDLNIEEGTKYIIRFSYND